MKVCKYCGTECTDGATRCPSCGSVSFIYSAPEGITPPPAPVPAGRPGRLSVGNIRLILIIAVILIGGWLYYNSHQNGFGGETNRYYSQLYNSAQSDVNAGNYEAAIRTLDSIDPAWNSGRVSALRSRAVREFLTQQASSYMARGDYESVIALASQNADTVNSDQQARQVYNTALSAYVDRIRRDAAYAYQTGGYGAAISVVNQGMAVTGGDLQIKALKDQYEAMAPKPLTEMEPFVTTFQKYARQVGINGQDKLGNTYNNCIEYLHGMKDLFDTAEEIYVLNYRYSRFQGTLFVPKERNPKYDSWGESYFRIYGDGRLLYTSPDMVSTRYPVNFSISVSGVDQLKFTWSGGSPTWDQEIGLGNAFLFK